MQPIQIAALRTAPIAMGCMRVSTQTAAQLERWIHTALEHQINLFDHADIYGGGQSEALFGEVLKRNPGLRGQIILQSKCGIRKGCYDLSKQHIVDSVNGSLRRLQTERLDLLLFHRPDALMEPEEIGEAMECLSREGKVGHFGVSNMNPAQIEWLRSATSRPMVVNQMQFSLLHASLVTHGVHVNMDCDESVMRDGGTLAYCQRHGIALQAWSPFQYGMFQGCFLDNDQFPALNEKLRELAQAHQVSPSAIAVAWILRIPGPLQAVIGTTNPQRVSQIAKALEVRLSREEWYALYSACGYTLP